ncbi:MAG TPA: polyphosphate kinase 2 [Desulfobulbaceae bacterium]|nr:polyphosphate kinase 2 [Desulfobulbaceae bacterium]
MEKNDKKKQEDRKGKEKKEKTAQTADIKLYEGTAARFLKEKKKDGNVAVWVPKKTLSYELELKKLQVELTKLQQDMKKKGTRILAIFEGRDAAGKGGTISRITAFLNPRNARIVALTAPSDREATQWYFQRYVPHLPAAGELVLFDRSWYNRAMVEPVMGFCTEEQHKRFLEDVPHFEEMLVKDGIHLFKFYFSVSRKEQARRFEARKTDILKQYKLSPVDNLAQKYWDQYTVKKFEMLNESNRATTPWTVIRSDNKKMARINCIKFLLSCLDYDKKIDDEELIPDPDIVIAGSDEIKHMEKNLLDPKRLPG